ncbi:MAG: dihydroxy-acid dehydratase [Cyclobacteriaceae bacterium]|nr:dihydroxy-acid dehydratase [Cyclobacteriaceae bacterium]
MKITVNDSNLLFLDDIEIDYVKYSKHIGLLYTFYLKIFGMMGTRELDETKIFLSKKIVSIYARTYFDFLEHIEDIINSTKSEYRLYIREKVDSFINFKEQLINYTFNQNKELIKFNSNLSETLSNTFFRIIGFILVFLIGFVAKADDVLGDTYILLVPILLMLLIVFSIYRLQNIKTLYDENEKHHKSYMNYFKRYLGQKDIDELSKKIPTLCKVAPSSHYHMQDVNRAGGIMAILGELDRCGLIDTSVFKAGFSNLKAALNEYDVMNNTAIPEAKKLYTSAPGLVKNIKMGSQDMYYKELDKDRAKGCIRDYEHAYNRDGGLAVLFGNIARDGCIVKTAGVDPSVFKFKGVAKIFESQDSAVESILNGDVKPKDVVVIRYEGPKGGPGMQEMLYPTSYIKSRGLDKQCALITDGRFSGGTSGLSIGHISPEAAGGGEIALLRNGDPIEIDLDKRMINVMISEEELDKRRKAEEDKGDKAWQPAPRERKVSAALRAYASMVSSADKGAVRLI